MSNVDSDYLPWSLVATDDKSNMFALRVGLSLPKKIYVICFIESPLKMIENAFYFILKALFTPKIFNFFSWLFGHVEKTAWSINRI